MTTLGMASRYLVAGTGGTDGLASDFDGATAMRLAWPWSKSHQGGRVSAPGETGGTKTQFPRYGLGPNNDRGTFLTTSRIYPNSAISQNAVDGSATASRPGSLDGLHRRLALGVQHALQERAALVCCKIRRDPAKWLIRKFVYDFLLSFDDRLVFSKGN